MLTAWSRRGRPSYRSALIADEKSISGIVSCFVADTGPRRPGNS